ncbi:MAG TPA: PHP domain-containing protein [Actinomycetota bacterium]|jgi:predicted metal-dependent phosphoesterase TrpH|nr:PHP domain-containing protein [Actinomycetota bacterium]
MKPRSQKIDLHTHTVYSDGTFTPAQSVELALERGLTALSISDHDSTEGLPEALRAAEGTGLEIVPGVEFSTIHEHGGVHMLTYWPDVADREFQAELQRLREDRYQRGERMVRKLQDLGYPVLFERVREIASGKNIGRPHIAQALVEAGVVAEVKEAFSDELIGTGGRAYVEKHALHPLDALPLMKRAGGLAVLAHPVHWRDGLPVPDQLIEEMVQAGLDGIEAAHPDHDPDTEARYREMAKRFGIVATGSSDCHGARYDPIRMGSVTTDPEEFARLKARKEL